MKSSKFPNLSSFLEYAKETTVPKKKGLPNILSFVLFAATTVGAYMLAHQWLSIFPSLLVTFFIGMPIAGSVVAAIDNELKRPKTPQEHEDVRRHQIVNDLHSRADSRKLHKELDPSAAQLLEACAHYWNQIRRALTGPAWADPDVSGQYAMLREQSFQAANGAMLEALLLCAPCVGTPQRKKSDDLKEAWEDLLDLDWEDALDGFRRVAKAESHEYAFHSPHIRQVFQPVREIAERLKMLAEEVEQVSSEMLHSKAALPGTGAVSGIDLVLKEFQMSRQAEAELDQRLHQGG